MVVRALFVWVYCWFGFGLAVVCGFGLSAVVGFLVTYVARVCAFACGWGLSEFCYLPGFCLVGGFGLWLPASVWGFGFVC